MTAFILSKFSCDVIINWNSHVFVQYFFKLYGKILICLDKFEKYLQKSEIFIRICTLLIVFLLCALLKCTYCHCVLFFLS